jgi:LacI family transcriptional regulator
MRESEAFLKASPKSTQTIHNIASLSGVSPATVSRVLNGNPNVKEETRQRVLDVIRAENYHPSQSARSLSNRRTDCLGLVIPNSLVNVFIDPYFPTIITAISDRAQEVGYTIMLGLGRNEQLMYNQLVERRMVDGILIVSSVDNDWLTTEILSSSIPSVIVGRPSRAMGSYVDVDNRLGAQQAVDHLIRLHYEHIATIAGPQTMVAGRDRLTGYHDALRMANRREAMVVYSDFTQQRGYIAMQELLSRDPRPDAVFCANDATAIGAMQAVREYGLSIPEDVAIVGFDDIPLATQVSPALTTVRQPIALSGQMCLSLLLEQLENPDQPPQHLLLPTELVIRQSCGMTARFN